MLQAEARTVSRRIGPFGTGARVVVGVALLVLALVDGPAGFIGRLEVYEVVLGLVVFPGVMVGIGRLAARYGNGPLRLTSLVWLAANCAVIIALFLFPYTGGAAALFYGVSLLVGAGLGMPHCEATVLSNLLLGREDEIGCPCFTPIDAMERAVHSGRQHA
jgi:hypothetical protein